jgi:3-phosphoshikimate 1-carboxyvinyltransferase
MSSSKSESNRALVIQALSAGKIRLENVSDARDTRIMQELLVSNDLKLNVLDAGTTMRFLTAYFAITNQHKILSGTPRMNQRPIGILVEALQKIGAHIDYLGTPGYPPIEIHGIDKQLTDKLSIRGDVSSQYISALLMTAPKLPEGLTLKLTGKLGSVPYIEMTLELMKACGIQTTRISENIFQVLPGDYSPMTYRIESDWSGASYWFSLMAIAAEGKLRLPELRQNSLQGDRCIVELMEPLGVKSDFQPDFLELSAGTVGKNHVFEYDFTNCPDLAQTLAVVCAAKGIEARFRGLESLRIKETDRIAALQNELRKFGSGMKETDPGVWNVLPVKLEKLNGSIEIETYDDHRMAMAFAPMAMLTELSILNPSVVNKSYPGFWNALEQAGFELEFS